MARPLRIEFDGAVYHVTARGNDRKKIFFTKRDYERFKDYLTVARERFGCFLHGYALMGNHYHLILETPHGNLSRVMHYINGSYTTYINTKRKRRGHLLQGRYKSILVDKDAYLLELSRYVHLNPVRAGIVERPEDYAYSSYQSFAGKKQEPFLSTRTVLAMVSTRTSVARSQYREFVESALGRDIPNPFEAVYGGMMLGKSKFIKEMLRQLESGVFERSEVSHRKALNASIDAELILERICPCCNLGSSELDVGGDRKVRKIAVYILKKCTSLSNHEIGRLLGGLSYSGVSKCFHRFEGELQTDKGLRTKLERLVAEVSNVKG